MNLNSSLPPTILTAIEESLLLIFFTNKKLYSDFRNKQREYMSFYLINLNYLDKINVNNLRSLISSLICDDVL